MSARAEDAAPAGPRRREPFAVTLILLADGDDVVVAARDLGPGRHLTSAGTFVVVREHVPLGHKVAARDLAEGDHVARAGMSIGSATCPIRAGDWVHTHNLASDYIATFAHRGGER